MNMADELIAGKFKDDAALEQGIREGMKATTGVELPATVKVIGEGGLYADQAAAVTGYKGIESSLGKLKAPAKPADTGVIKIGPQAPAPGTEIDDPAEAVKAAGIDWADIEKAVTEGGKPTDEHYAKLKSVGWNKAAVNAYVAGERASRQGQGLAYEAAVTSVGGRDKVKALVAEAEKHIPASEYGAYAAMLASPAQLPIAVRAMQAIVGEKKGNDFVTGGGNAGGVSVSTISEYQALVRKAASGDKAALEAVGRIKNDQIGSLK
jgi:hypothetical protein